MLLSSATEEYEPCKTMQMTEHTHQAVNDYLKVSRKKRGEFCEPSSFCSGRPR
jgi:hypothetical protein